MSESVGLIDDLDRPIYGAKDIGAVVNLSERQTYHALEQGYLDGDKFGRKWRSTKRRLLKPTALLASPPDRSNAPSDTAAASF